MGQLQAGIATVDITPPVGTWLAGFAGRHKGSEGIHDPLRARALVLDDGDTRLLIITCDILSLAYPFIDDLKARIEAESGLPPERVMVNCSHTHSGPVTRT
ncbi:MAG: neutral/alkaline non-lysosomal ceramidase N-terminal domain-containing protein, partial [Acidobacteriota bacterium]|nr:neutral/alkaline non-lysosomal ceramidase N-terminal domain-containing protein [Acidobacteriota bacterium]